jgi:hypothetical protein
MKSFKQHFLTEANNLAPGELYKYQVRVDKFIEKFKKKSPFVLTTGETVVLKYDKAVADAILNKDNPTKIVLKSADGTTSYTLGKFAKTAEFGGAEQVAGAGSAITKLTESAQCVYSQALWNGTKDYNDADLKEAYSSVNVDESLENILNLSESWKKSCIIGAELLYKTFGKKNYTFHRGSSWVQNLEKVFMKLNKVDKFFSNLNKWSPADIYMLSPVGAQIKFDDTIDDIVELNKVLYEALASGDIVGVSLKKMAKGGKIDYYNYDEEKKVIEFDKFTTGADGFFSSKDIYIYFTVNGKVQFRTFSEPTSWQGEIKGKIANGGKLGYGPIQGVLRRLGLKQLTDVKVLKSAIDKMDPIMLKKFYENYSRYANDSKKLSYDAFKDQVETNGKPWLFSKYIGLELIDIVSDANEQDDFITSSIQYASSQSELSAPFIKIHSD